MIRESVYHELGLYVDLSWFLLTCVKYKKGERAPKLAALSEHKGDEYILLDTTRAKGSLGHCVRYYHHFHT